jgi:hypothetical protein
MAVCVEADGYGEAVGAVGREDSGEGEAEIEEQRACPRGNPWLFIHDNWDLHSATGNSLTMNSPARHSHLYSSATNSPVHDTWMTPSGPSILHWIGRGSSTLTWELIRSGSLREGMRNGATYAVFSRIRTK